MDGDGLETVGLASNVYFDHDGDSVLTKTGWAGADDALLVWDRNANGSIDTGAELFGDFTPLPNGTLAPNGFAALAALDQNGDGILDASDPAFAELKLWQDASQDGVSQGGEFISLADAGIASLNLANTLKSQRLNDGNTLSREGFFTRADGSVSGMGEFRLATDTFDTKFADTIEVPEEIKSLPNMGGAGNVRELWQAAAQSGSVAGLLAQFQTAATRAEQRALIEQLLIAWADTSGMAQSLEERAQGKYRIQHEAFGNERRSSNMDMVAFVAVSSGSVSGGAALMTDFGGMYLTEHYRHLIAEWNRKLHVLEAFNGQYFFNLPDQKSQTDGANWGLSISAGSGSSSGGAATVIEAFPLLRMNFSQPQLDLLQQAYDGLKDSVYASLAMQTRLQPYLDQVELVIDDQSVRLDASQLNRMLADKRILDPENALADLLDLDRYAGSFFTSTNWEGLANFDQMIESLPQTPAIAALLAEFKVGTFTDANESQLLENGNDIVTAGRGDDVLYGNGGNDRLFGQEGDDRISGGAGDDLISGGADNDVLFGQSGADTYVFRRGFGNDTILDIAENGVRRDTVRFLDLNPSDIRVVADAWGNVIFIILDTGETLTVPYAGDDWGRNGVGHYVFDDGTVWGHDDVLQRAMATLVTEDNDVILDSDEGGAIRGLGGDDFIVGNGGDDVIDGGAGDDVIVGVTGWSWIYDNGQWRSVRNHSPAVFANGNDTYLFGRGDGKDAVTDGDWSAGNVDTLRFKEGVAPEDVRLRREGNDLTLAILGTGDQVTLKRYFDEQWNGASGAHLIERIAFADGTAWGFDDVQARLFAGSDEAETIIGSRASDLLTGQGGDDTLVGREGDDSLEGGNGNDVLFGGAGGDVLDGGAGNDVLRGGGAIGLDNQPYDGYGEGDTYRFGRGDGRDTLIEDSWLAEEADRIELKAGVDPADVRLERVRTTKSGGQVEDDLRLTIRDTGETITVKRHFDASGRNAVEEIAFTDGTAWDAEAIKSRSLLGEAGDDELRGFNDRDDVIDGGAGNDVLEGGSSSDIYHFGPGYGQDVIVEGNTAGQDGVELLPGIAPDDVTVRWTLQGDMAVTLPDGSRLTVRGQANPWSNELGIEQLRFADGTAWDRAELASRALAATEGSDAIVGGYGDDTIDGGAGDDRLRDLDGDDIYRFGAGDGQDVIEDSRGRILFKPGIAQNDVAFTRNGNDLIATVSASGDAVRIKDWLNDGQRIDRFDFDDGTSLGLNNVLELLDVNEGEEVLFGSPNGDTLDGTEKDSILYGREGDDVLNGGAGRDNLYGEAGDDTLDGGADRDELRGGAGQNTYIVAPGAGLDTAVAASASVADDTVLFAAGVRIEDVSVQMGEQSWYWGRQPGDVGYNRIVVGIGGNDALILQNENRDDLGRGAIKRFRFDDGTELSLEEMVARSDGGVMGGQNRYWGDAAIILGSAADDDIQDYTGESVVVRARGNDDGIHLAAGNDVVSAGSGNDDVHAGAGDDLIAGEAGDDQLNAGDGDDTFAFNHGDGGDVVLSGNGVDTLSFGAGVTPDMLAASFDREGRLVLAIDGGGGDTIALDDVRADNLPGGLERLQFIDASGRARIFDFAGWVRTNALALMAASDTAPFAFAGEAFELTGRAAPAGGLEAVAFAQTGDLFATANLAANTTTDGDDVLYGTPEGDTLDAGAGNDIVLGLKGDDTILGGEGGDLILGDDGDDVLDGGAGADAIHGGWGSDILSGGTGRDELYGEWNGDIYLYRAGDGEVVIDDDHHVLNWGDGGEGGEWEGGEGGYGGAIVDDVPNVLAFGPDIQPEDLRYSEQNGDLVIEFAGRPDDRVILRGFDSNRATQTRSVDIIRFADGTEIATESIEPSGRTETLDDEGGMLSGTPFADTLIGGEGDDVLEGNGGSDRLAGGAGSDTYRIHKEWGTPPTQTIIAETWREQDVNRLELTGEFIVDDLRLEFDGRDLLLRLNEDGDTVRFAGFDPRAPGMQAPVAEISLPWQGLNLSFDDLLAQGVRIIGTPENDVLTGTELADWIEGRGADDTLSGGAGGDIYVVGYDEGSDTIIDSEGGEAPNVLVLPEYTTLDDIGLSFDGEGFLVIDLGSGRVRLSGFDPMNPLGQRAVDRFRFGPDGDEIGYEELLARGFDIVGTEESDTLRGTVLADRVWGGDGNDLIEATPGGDLLMGDAGNDAYVVNPGDGIVTIDDAAEPEAGNTLRFGPGIDPDALRNSLRFEEDGNGGHVLLIPYGGEGDVVRLAGFDPQDVLGSHAIERFEFADGTAVDYATLVSWTFVVEGDSTGNALVGTNVGDRLYGYDGDDVLDAGAGEDVLTGGAGSDLLRGDAGRDAYVVNLGDGEDIIEDDVEAGIGNILTFGEGIDREDVRVETDGVDLLVRYGVGNDVVRVLNYASADGGTAIDTFEFADGTAVTLREFMNRAPEVANPVGDQIVLEDAAFRLTLPDDLFTDADGDAPLATVAVSGYERVPSWLKYDAGTRTLYGTPGNDDVGEFDVVVQGMDALGASGFHGFHVAVENTNDAPEVALAIADLQAAEDAPFAFALPEDAFRDADAGDTLTFGATLADGSPLPSWLGFDAATLTFVGTPANGDVGSLSLKVTATDLAGESASQVFSLDVSNTNDAPVVANAIADQIAIEDAAFDFTVPTDAFADIDAGDTLTLSASLADGSALPSWITFDAATRTFSGTPANDDVGGLSLKVTATDTAGASASASFDLTVANVNDAPILVEPLADQGATEDNAFSFALPAGAFADVDAGDTLAYSATLADGSPLPSWLGFDATAGTFSGTPANGDVGTVSVRVAATDASGAGASDTFDLAVSNVNDGPRIVEALADQGATEDTAFEFAIPGTTFEDIDTGDVLSYSAMLANGDPLPTWLSFDAATCTFSGTPGNDDVGSLTVGVVATDLAGANASASFGLTVANVNDAPILVEPLADQTVRPGDAFAYSLPADAFADVDAGDRLSYSASLSDGNPLPSWLAFDAATGAFSGKAPRNAKGGLDIRVTASDGHGADSTASDVFRLNFDRKGGCHGNEGLGNGEDPPPPGHDHNWNDGPGTRPGHPGARDGHDGGPRPGGNLLDALARRFAEGGIDAAAIARALDRFDAACDERRRGEDRAWRDSDGCTRGRDHGHVTHAAWTRMNERLDRHLFGANGGLLGGELPGFHGREGELEHLAAGAGRNVLSGSRHLTGVQSFQSFGGLHEGVARLG